MLLTARKTLKILIDIAEYFHVSMDYILWAEILLGIRFKMNCKPL